MEHPRINLWRFLFYFNYIILIINKIDINKDGIPLMRMVDNKYFILIVSY
jgi:hypothetical protein